MEHKKHSVLIDGSRCVGCGMCAKDCVAGCITVTDGKAHTAGEGCIFCGHCEAVCPQGAVSLTGFRDESVPFAEQTRLDSQELMDAIKTRRSVRQFKPDAVPDEMLKQIIEAGRLAPTGSNAQNTGFIVLGAKQAELEELAVQWFRKLAEMAKPFLPFLKRQKMDEHFFFKGAPLVIVITGNAVNASLAAENMAFMAEALGLGVLFSGFFTVCANKNKKIRAVCQMGKNEKAVTTLVLGYPDVTYHRTARREDARIRLL